MNSHLIQNLFRTVILVLLVTLLTSCHPTSKTRSLPAFSPPKDGLDSLAIWTEPGESRPFLLANRTGTYFYGATGTQWDPGWMGLWVNRERVLKDIQFLDSQGNALNLDSAWCRVTPADVTWIWDDTPPRKEVNLCFVARRDTLYYQSESGIRIEGDHWIQPKPADLPLLLRAELLDELHSNFFACDDTTYTRAVAWANLQLLFLLAEGDSILYAGIPWFNEGWGRDTFISLPGLLVTGHTDAARKILSRFADWIDRDPNSETYGRVPNRARPGEIVYNTADGTPWWVRELYEYGLYSRDYDFWKPLLTDSGAVRIAMDGALKKSDSLGFLHHPNEDTWMDAVAPDGVVTPRGDRAIDITALHAASLDLADRMAAKHPGMVPNRTRVTWQKTHESIHRNILSLFLAPDGERLWDRIQSNDAPDTVTRPNQLYALTVPYTPLIPPTVQSKMVRFVSRELLLPHGIMSLSPRDTAFHPYHMDWHYPKDDAYHQGIVWVWQSGAAKSALRMEGRADLALELANYEARLMQERGLIGSLPELLDAKIREGNKEPYLSGTTTQAWSLAEFLRTTHQDFLGIRPVFVKGRLEPFWLIDPRIPEEWGTVEARVHLEGIPLFLTINNYGDSLSVVVLPEVKPEKPIGLKLFDDMLGITGYINVDDRMHFVYHKSDSTATVDGTPTARVKMTGWPYDSGPQDIRFADPITREDFASLKDPDWKILTGEDALCDANNAEMIWSATDPMEDDTGFGGYQYPTDIHFEPGILDITNVDISRAGDKYHFDLTFRNLVQPGWHPEYGFQLTFAALCLRTPSGKRGPVELNSNYFFEGGMLASRIIVVGGGVHIEDDSNRLLAEFIPRSIDDAFGDVGSKRISFCLPVSFFPEDAEQGMWTILVGAQDDHGGAGIGEFRSVKAEAEQWAGGGRTSDDQPNVYDVVYVNRVLSE